MSFDADAPYYDLFSARDYAAAAAKIVEAFPNADDVLEIGAGTGSLTVELEALGLNVTALEPSVQMRAHFKSNTAMVVPETLENFYPYRAYDLGILDYSVLKFIPDRIAQAVAGKLQTCCYETAIGFDIPVARPKMFERITKVGITQSAVRQQFCIRFRKRGWLWYLYATPTGSHISFHRLYFHDMKDFRSDHE